MDLEYGASRLEALAENLRSTRRGDCILICWRHGGLPKLLAALGADPYDFLPSGIWPEFEYGAVVHLRYDSKGRLNRRASKTIELPIFTSNP